MLAASVPVSELRSLIPLVCGLLLVAARLRARILDVLAARRLGRVARDGRVCRPFGMSALLAVRLRGVLVRLGNVLLLRHSSPLAHTAYLDPRTRRLTAVLDKGGSFPMSNYDDRDTAISRDPGYAQTSVPPQPQYGYQQQPYGAPYYGGYGMYG